MSLQNCNDILKGNDPTSLNQMILQDKNACTGCYSCYNICPVKAIKMNPDSEGFLYPEIESDNCIKCGYCRKVCPVLNKPVEKPEAQAFAAYAKDEAEHRSSSSGGVFAILARYVLGEGGVVCGAAFNAQMKVQHIMIETEDSLAKLKETKYVQSEIGEIYSVVKSVLLEERQVLFSGTPCQVAGLKAFLEREYPNLLCIDLICHGVPSPEVFSRYLMEVSDQPVVRMTFRNKTSGISKVMLDYESCDGTRIQERYDESPYIIGFIQNLYTRPSCFHCNFKGEKRTSDLTIGDFWGVQEFHPSFITDQGVSAVIIHSEKGLRVFNKVCSQLVVEAALTEEIKAWNLCLVQSVGYNPKREIFFRKWKKQTIRETVMELRTEKKLEKLGVIRRIKGKIKKWLA